MTGTNLAAAMLVLLAVAHSALGEAGIIGPLLRQQWAIDEPRWAVDRILRFAWHLTSVAWLALAAVLLGVGILPAVAAAAAVSGAIVFVMLRGHLAWPLFTLAALGALRADGRLTDGVLDAGAIAAMGGLAVAAAVHVYWALGGRWMLDRAVPAELGDRPPGPLLTLAVAAGLLVFAGLVGAAAFDVGPAGSRPLVWAGVAVFGLRAFGDTKVAGFTKTEHETPFGRADDQWFTPIVVFIALGATAAVLPV